MKLISIPDIHGNLASLNPLLKLIGEVDLVLLPGDITNFGGREAAEEMIEPILDTNAHVLAVPGNCDLPEVSDYLDDLQINLHGRCTTIQNITFVGLGGSLPCPGRTPNEFSDQQFGKLLNAASKNLDRSSPIILVSHQPPYGTINDMAHNRRHVGSRSVRSFIEMHDPLACFTGHIHEGRGIDRIRGCLVVNPAPPNRGRYVWAEYRDGNFEVEIRPIE